MSFQPEGHPVVVGMLTRYNGKSVTVVTTSGQRWNVAPTLLRLVDSSTGADDPGLNVIRLRRK